ADLTKAELEGRSRMHRLVDYVRANMPGFADAFVVDVAPQLGIRTSRLLEGEYVLTKEDVATRRHFADSVARGRDYYYPYRTLLPRGVKQLLVAGRHYSSTAAAQRISREIPPCMAMGEAVGVAASVALDQGVTVDRVDVAKVQRILRDQGGDPGDQPAPNATFEQAAE
ncbi:MAG: FAD-dependent oxidoreductase, partial [Geminicoccaceae bacterium]|nr:FAD-dependent oxidoreductase [Geminicoccaceae bacterium]